MRQYLGHVDDKALKRFKHAQYITINPTSLDSDYGLKSARLDDYIKLLTNAGKRRAKSHPLHNAQYIIIKEISHSETLGYHPHLNIIVFRDHTNPFPDLSGEYRSHVEPLSRTLSGKFSQYNDTKNPLTQNVKNIFIYSTKPDQKRINLERQDNLSFRKKDIFVSNLFKNKSVKSHSLIPIHIQDARRALYAAAKAAKTHAIRLHECYKVLHPNAKAITIHRHAQTTARKLARIEAKKRRDLSKLTPRRRRSRVLAPCTHT